MASPGMSRLVLAVLVGVSFSAVDVPLVARALGVVFVTFLYTLLQPPPATETADTAARAQGTAAQADADAAARRVGGVVTGGNPRPGSPTSFGRARSPLRPLPNPLDAVYYDDPDPKVVVSRPASRRSAGTVQQSRPAMQPPLSLSSTPAASETDAGMAAQQQRPRIPDLSLAADVATRRALAAASLGDATDAETAASAAEAAADALAAEAERIAAAVGAAVAAVTPPAPVEAAPEPAVAVVTPAAVRAAAISAGVEAPDPYPTVPPLAAPQTQAKTVAKPADEVYYPPPPASVKAALAAAKQAAAAAPVVISHSTQVPQIAAAPVAAAPPPPVAVKAQSPMPPPAQQPQQQRAVVIAAPAPAPAPARVPAPPPSPSPVGGQPPGDGRMSPLSRLFKSRRESGSKAAASPAGSPDTALVLVDGSKSAPAKPTGGFRFRSPFKGKREGSPVGERPEKSSAPAKAAAAGEPKAAPMRFWSPQKQQGEAQPQAPPPA